MTTKLFLAVSGAGWLNCEYTEGSSTNPEEENRDYRRNMQLAVEPPEAVASPGIETP